MKSMTKNRSSYIKIRNAMIGLAMAGIAVLVWYGFHLYQQRKAEKAEREAERMMAEAIQEAASFDTENAEKHDEITEPAYYDIMSKAREQLIYNENGTLTWKGKTYRRNTYIKAIVCMGVDRSNEMTESHTFMDAGQSDAVFVIIQDTVRNKIRILMIPRDTITRVAITDMEGHYTGEQRLTHLNMAYAFGDGREASCENVKTSTEYLLCGVTMDSYMAVDHAVISMVNDAVGGVEVTIPTEGMERSDPSFIKGNKVTLHGEQAERFVRYRDIKEDNTALYRMDQHEEYILQFFKAVKNKSREDSQIVPHLFDLIRDYMVTDMAKADYLKIGADALTSGGLTSEDILTIPGNGIAGGQFDEFYVDYNNAIPLILSLFYREV